MFVKGFGLGCSSGHHVATLVVAPPWVWRLLVLSTFWGQGRSVVRVNVRFDRGGCWLTAGNVRPSGEAYCTWGVWSAFEVDYFYLKSLSYVKRALLVERLS